jgi:acylphosphatase
MPEILRARILVTGLVQGVAFRAATTDEARRLGLHGWVRNRMDGSVAVEAEGERAAVEALAAWCRRGPPAARVDDVELQWITPTGDTAPFHVAR